MDKKEIIELLKQGSIKVIEKNQQEYRITHTCNNTTIYFWLTGNDGLYSSYVNNDENCVTYHYLLKRLDDVIRIEKEFDNEYFPIWTKEDGLINQSEIFVKLNGRYYTIKFLEQLLLKIKEFKKINI